MKISKIVLQSLLLLAVFWVFSGCATRGWVEKRVSKIESKVDENQAKVAEVGSRVDNLENRLPQFEEARRIAEMALKKISQIEGKKVVKRRVLSEEVRFGFDKWQLTHTTRSTLDRLSSRIAGIKYYSIVVIGHTDSIGSERYNLSLGLRRAQAVGVYLAQKEGIDPERISTITFGEGIPVSNNRSKEGRAKNRRVEILVFEGILD